MSTNRAAHTVILVDPSSLIFVVIVAGWAAYLVPAWVRRREQLAAGRTQDRHSSGSRVLEPRRPSAHGEGGASTSPILLRPATGDPDLAPDPSEDVVHLHLQPSAAARAARRRLTILLALLALTAVGAGLTFLPQVPWWAAVPASALLVLDILAILVTAPGRRGRRRDAQVDSPSAAPAAMHTPSAPMPAPSLPLADGEATQEIPVVTNRQAVVPAAVAEQAQDTREGTWTPVPVPLPTYALKPAAPRPVPRPLAPPEATVLLRSPGARSGGEPLGHPGSASASAAAQAAMAAAVGSSEEIVTLDLDAVLARRRAATG